MKLNMMQFTKMDMWKKKTGFSSYNYDYIEEYLRDYFEIDNGEKGINGPDFTKF